MVMHFCPYCHNLLLTEYGSDQLQFYCKTCPYVFHIKKKITSKLVLERKKVDDILGGGETNLDTVAARCEKCGNGKAYFFQMQTRSADEPMTVFYRCTNADCLYTWREQ